MNLLSKTTEQVCAFDEDASQSETESDNDSEYDNLDECIDKGLAASGSLQSIAKLIKGREPLSKRAKTGDLQPIVYVRFNTRVRNAKAKPVTLRALIDTGASATLVNKRHAQKLKALKTAGTVWSTPAGEMETTQKCRAQFTIPELHDNRLIEWNIHLAKDLGSYDMIIGRDIIQDLKMVINYSTQTIIWDGVDIPLKERDSGNTAYYVHEPVAVEQASSRIKGILDAKYEKADLEEICRTQTHLSKVEQDALLSLLLKYESAFDGVLGTWKGEEYNIELKPDAKPYHARAFPVPRIHMQTLKTEVERLCRIGVLKRVNRSDWAAPTFVIPKKDGTVRFISDFRELNKRILRKPFPIPKIQELLLNLEGFQYATSLDLNMGYYHIELNPTSKRYCTIVLPFGKFEYQRLPMGLCNSPDIFQEKVSELMMGLDFIRAYLDDVLTITSSTFADHLEKLELVLQRIYKAGLKVHARKSFFARSELEYLGYWITREGIQPLPDKVQAMMKVAAPTTRKELRSFIGLVNYYRDMWQKRSHLLAPLATLTSKATKWRWDKEEQEAFDGIKRVISREVMLSYPDFEKEFVIHTDASHHQLGAVISQDGKPIAFYSRKLKPEQTRYTTTERELLSIVETLKEFRNILLGHKIVVYTDHLNLTYKNFNTERVIRWRLILEEYGPELRYIKGSNNVVADALSRLPMNNDSHVSTNQEAMAEAFAVGDNELPLPTETYPLSYAILAQEQAKDAALSKRVKNNPKLYEKKQFLAGKENYSLYTWKERIVIPKTLQKRTVEWYHERLMHPGETRTELSIAQHYYWKGLTTSVKAVCTKCLACKLSKPSNKKYGHLPPKPEAEIIPWRTCCIDLIGPYTFSKKDNPSEDKNATTLICLTMIDPATGWFEIIETPDKRADTIANLFEQTWLNRYPWPQEVVLDRGKEFMGEVITLLRDEYGIKRKPITTRNPQANSMVERAHQTLHNLVRTQGIRDKRDLDPDMLWSGILTAVRFGMNSTVHTTSRATPAQLVFGRDAIHNTNFTANWQYIKERKQRLIIQNNKRENATRTPHTYSVGDQVLVHQDPNRKHGRDYNAGPYSITRVNDNGTVTLQQGTPHGGVLSQTWNIRNVSPYKD